MVYILVVAVGFLFSKLRFIIRKSNVQPIVAGTSLPGWPLENGALFLAFMHKKFIGFVNVPFWQLRLRCGFSKNESC